MVLPQVTSAPVLRRLKQGADERDLGPLSERLTELMALLRVDLKRFEETFQDLPTGERGVQLAAHHLTDRSGKRLRPICVMLAARLGTGVDHRVTDLAVAAELVHSATLLHDDVVDLGEMRRGGPTSRRVYGNATSVFAGDWLLVEALRRVTRANVPGAMLSLYDMLEEMIFAESVQLEGRERFELDRRRWERIVLGKTASLFRWSMSVGAKAAGLSDDSCAALSRYGEHLGIAFQVTDDTLDLVGDPDATGKALFADLREGKMTYPLIVGVERDPELGVLVQNCAPTDDAAMAKVASRLVELGAVESAQEFARANRDLAIQALQRVEVLSPEKNRIDSLVTVAHAAIERRK